MANRSYRHSEFIRACELHYPDDFERGGLLDQGAYDLIVAATAPVEFETRFVRPTARSPRAAVDGWAFPMRGDLGVAARTLTYRGLINLKSPFDLALYTRLLWELQPRTVLELGSYQGGSSLWFADQAEILCEHSVEVHSFDVRPLCISDQARHPRLTFHAADLTDPEGLPLSEIGGWPHPWLVVDDAHANVTGVLEVLDRHLSIGDYYVVEDVGLSWPVTSIVAMANAFERRGYMVDTEYADGFGPNVTCAPNSWFRKVALPS
jgi:cephalosporin hydroxylase